MNLLERYDASIVPYLHKYSLFISALIPGQPPEYCQLRWGFEVPGHIMNPVSEAFTQNLEQRLGNLVYTSMRRESAIETLLFSDSIRTKVSYMCKTSSL